MNINAVCAIQGILWLEKGRLWCSTTPPPIPEHLAFIGKNEGCFWNEEVAEWLTCCNTAGMVSKPWLYCKEGIKVGVLNNAAASAHCTHFINVHLYLQCKGPKNVSQSSALTVVILSTYKNETWPMACTLYCIAGALATTIIVHLGAI